MLRPMLLASSLLSADAYFVTQLPSTQQRHHIFRSAAPQMGSTADFKVGLTIEFENSVWRVQEFLHVKPGKGSAFVRSKLKNLQNGNTLEKTWKAGETFPDAQVDRNEMTYTYIDGDDHVFMNMETFEEERIATADIEKVEFLKEDATIDVLYWQGKAIDVQIPKVVTLKVTEAAPGAKGNTAQGRTEKPVTLETGAQVNVPMFINEGELVRVDTEDRKYLGRANE
jgi:elongation factor P